MARWVPAFAGMTLCALPTVGTLPRRADDRALIDLLPLAGLVEHHRGIDDLELAAIEWRLDLPAHGDELAAGQNLLPLAEQEVEEQHCRIGMRSVAGEALRGGARDRRRQHKPIERRALELGLLGEEAVDRKRQRHLAGGDQVGEQAVTLAHGDAVLVDDLAKEPHRCRLARAWCLPHLRDHLREPVEILRLDPELALPFRPDEVVEAAGRSEE